MTTLVHELNAMHAHYVDAVNTAVESGDLDRALQLAEDYDTEAIHLMAVREGKTHLLPLRRPAHADSALRRLVRRLTPRAPPESAPPGWHRLIDWTGATHPAAGLLLARFASGLYSGKARDLYEARVRRDPFTRLRGREGRDDPYPVYEEIRAHGRFSTTRLGNLATPDHAACQEVLRSRRFGVRPEHDDTSGEPGGFDLSFLDRNPPDHTRLRRLAAPAFSPKRVAGYEATIEKTVADLLDGAGGEFDLVERLAAPLPIAVITHLLGVPDADTERFTRYGRVIGSALSGVTSVSHARALAVANAELDALFADLFALRRREPRDDVISDLVAHEGEQVRPEEMRPLCQLLLIAGFETTVNLVGNAVHALLDHPDQWALLRDDPGLAHAATVETLRYDAPVQRTIRVSFDDTEVAGQRVRRDQLVHVLIGGANRDPAVFDRPDVFDLTRGDADHHLAFSSGIHHCVGRPLAELEATVALRVLAERLPRLRRAGAVRRRDATLIRGPVRLPVAG